MSKTNYLGSHSPEHTSFPADKMIPKEFLRYLNATGRRVHKKLHVKRSRRFNKQITLD